jgi:hypothetical protein
MLSMVKENGFCKSLTEVIDITMDPCYNIWMK